MRESELLMQFGRTWSWEPPGKAQMHNPGRVHLESAEYHNILIVFKPS